MTARPPLGGLRIGVYGSGGARQRPRVAAGARQAEPRRPRRARPDHVVSDLAANAVEALERASARFDRLTLDPPNAWLAPDVAAAFHGRAARDAWSEDAAAATRVARAAASDLAALAPVLTPIDAPWLDDAPRADQDFGAMGQTQLLERVHALLDAVEAAPTVPDAPPAHAYDLFDRHPECRRSMTACRMTRLATSESPRTHPGASPRCGPWGGRPRRPEDPGRWRREALQPDLRCPPRPQDLRRMPMPGTRSATPRTVTTARYAAANDHASAGPS